MPTRVLGAFISGMEAVPVSVEVVMRDGLPGLSIAGMADAAVLEARRRIRCAIQSCGFSMPRKRITVVLHPGDVRKVGTALDLAIAVGILAASGQIPVKGADDLMFFGGLDLDGEVLPERGAVAVQLLAHRFGRMPVVSPSSEISPRSGAALAVSTLSDLRSDSLCRLSKVCPRSASGREVDMLDVPGASSAKRALAVAAASGRGVMLFGGTEEMREMLAERASTVMPDMSAKEVDECALVASVCGESIAPPLAGVRPYRKVGPDVSAASLVGGGRPVRPGEVSLSHGGVLHLLDACEFRPLSVQMVAAAVRGGSVEVVRVEGKHTLPSSALVVATGPDVDGCPRVCGALRPIVDLRAEVSTSDACAAMSSAELRDSVERARAAAEARGHGRFAVSSEIERAADLAVRGTSVERDIVLEIARTVADMEGCEMVHMRHVEEAARLCVW